MTREDRIEQAAELIRHAQHMVAFTGAGHSTGSGIPDFRSPGSGLWEKANPMLVASIWAFRLNPKSFYDWIRPLALTMLTAPPNPAHYALAALEEAGILKAIITQNIDNLHQRAGSRRVLELHGHMREATCIRCYAKVAIDPAFENLILEGKVPYCKCGGVYKPDVILFGEQLPVRVLNQAVAEARRADLILIAGSSLEVTPAADIPYLAAESGARSIIVNLQRTGFDAQADVVIHGDVVDILPRLVEAVRQREAP
ncbi:MAG: NAD-dependent deacylase [Anaerolineae bacterium]|nr:NAD-dependent deacylase [Anaerolineae bacterium]